MTHSQDWNKYQVFKETPGIFPAHGPPKWVVRQPPSLRQVLNEQVFNTGDEAIAYVRDQIDRITEIRRRMDSCR